MGGCVGLSFDMAVRSTWKGSTPEGSASTDPERALAAGHRGISTGFVMTKASSASGGGSMGGGRTGADDGVGGLGGLGNRCDKWD